MPVNRPLIICDVDEVVLHFVSPFEAFLERQGFRLVKRSYALSGNIIDRDTDQPVPGERIGALVHAFFDSETHAQPKIPGAAEALAELSESADILFLTNFPDNFRARREQNLLEHGMPYPLHTNSGPKGQAASELARHHTEEIVFLDDIGSNLTSVREHIPGATLIQFIGDHKLFDLAPPIEEIDFKTKNWTDAKAYIDERLNPPA